MRANEFITESWSQKYKKSINCSHPKGFSQKAHCAGKKKHNEDMSMEMVCEDCGMCQTHGNLNEIAKGAKDSNGFTKCWPGKHAEGTKKGRNGGQVRNCVPNESQVAAEAIVSSGDATLELLELNIFKDLIGEHSLSNYDEEFAQSHNWQKVVARWAPKAERLYDAVIRLHNAGKKISSQEARAITDTAYDGSDAYNDPKSAASDLPRIYAQQYNAILQFVQNISKPDMNMHEQGVAEGLGKRCQQCGMSNCSCAPGKCKCKPISGWIPNKGFKKAVDEGIFDSKPKVDWNKRAKELFAKGFTEQQVAQQLIKEGCPANQVNVYVQAGQLEEDWNKVNHHDKTNGLSQKAVNSYRREHPGSKLQTAVTTKPNKLKAGSKDAKRRKSFCARMSGNKGPMKKPNGKPTPKALALRRWNCESIEEMQELIKLAEQHLDTLFEKSAIAYPFAGRAVGQKAGKAGQLKGSDAGKLGGKQPAQGKLVGGA
jgi:hypothetical protein